MFVAGGNPNRHEIGGRVSHSFSGGQRQEIGQSFASTYLRWRSSSTGDATSRLVVNWLLARSSGSAIVVACSVLMTRRRGRSVGVIVCVGADRFGVVVIQPQWVVAVIVTVTVARGLVEKRTRRRVANTFPRIT